MIDPFFSIDVDLRRRSIVFVMRGFWSAETLVAYDREYRHKVNSTRWSSGDHTVLADLTGLDIQAKPVFEHMRAMIEYDPNPPRRFALACGQGLARMQFRRVVLRDDMRLFSTRSEAEAWLGESARKTDVPPVTARVPRPPIRRAIIG